MPYSPRSPRRIRRHIITHGDVCRANNQVTCEMDALGFWSDRLDTVEVWWTRASLSFYGWYEGDIHIPAVSGAQLSDYIAGRHIRLTDILRHEWAHAVADKWPEFIETRRFEQVFGAAYESEDPPWSHDPVRHVTRYAAVMPCEDFAEVFHFYLKHKGRLPQRLASKPAIVRKWAFMEWLAGRITRHG